MPITNLFSLTTRRILCLMAALLSSLSTMAGPLEDGHTAYNEKRYIDAFKLWVPLAEKGDAEAQYNLALLYMNGLGINKDDRRALEWMHKAARQGMLDAQYNLGVMYYEGRGAYRSDKSAIEWWQLAAEQGHPNAQYNLGVMYGTAIGVKRDPDKALSLWQDAANQGHPDAIEMLVRAYKGELTGFKADTAQASRWQQRLNTTKK